jgi:hypothetical protein
MRNLKIKTFLFKSYLQMLFFDTLQFWSYKENRKESKSIYKLLKAMYKNKP